MTHTANVQFGLELPMILMSAELGCDVVYIGVRVNGVDDIPMPLQEQITQAIYNGVHAGLAFSERPLPDKGLDFVVTVGPLPSEFNGSAQQIGNVVAGTTYTLFENLMCAHSSD